VDDLLSRGVDDSDSGGVAVLSGVDFGCSFYSLGSSSV